MSFAIDGESLFRLFKVRPEVIRTKMWLVLASKPCVSNRTKSHYEDPSAVTYEDLEKDYWRLVKNTTQEAVQVYIALD